MTFEEMLRALAQQTMQINATLQTVATAVAQHEQRMSAAEETLRQVLITQQAITDILERLNGR
jgi:ABC-type transporter Mla subunit MlaD